MSPRILTVSACCFIALSVAPALRAGQVAARFLPSAGVSQPWASQMNDPRIAAMGGAGAVVAEGSASLQSNPGGLDSLVDPELGFSHDEVSSEFGLRLEDIYGGRRWGDGVVAGMLRYSSLGSFDDRDSNGALLGSSNEAGYAGTLGYGQSFWTDTLHAGVSFGGSQETLSGQSFSQFTLSAGAIYQLFGGFRAGLALMNMTVGGQGSADSSERLGLGWTSLNRRIKVSSEWQRRDLGSDKLGLGAEWIVAGDYSLRAGYRFAQGESNFQDSGFSAGAGVQLGGVRLDYAYSPFGDFGATQRIAATLNLGIGLFGGGNIVIEAAGASVTAESNYKDGMAAFARKDWYEAKVALKNVLKIYPSFHQAEEIQKTLAELDKTIAAEKASGGGKNFSQALSRKLGEAKDLIQNGELAEARLKLDEVFSYDPGLKEGVELRKRLDGIVQSKTSKLNQEAQAALEEGDLATATLRYRSVLALNSDDKEAHDRLVRLNPRIISEVSKMHREGIDAYVIGDMDKAVALWTKAISLEPRDPRSIKTDLARAKKVLEFRAKERK